MSQITVKIQPSMSLDSLQRSRELDTSARAPSNRLPNYLRIYFNFAFFTCCCPFRLKRVPSSSTSSSQFVSVSWLPQKLFCIISTFADLFFWIHLIRSGIPRDAKNPTHYFAFIINIISFIYKFTFIESFWRQRDGFAELLNSISKWFPTSNRPSQFRPSFLRRIDFTSLLIYLCGTVATASAFDAFIFGRRIRDLGQEQWSIYRWWELMTEAGYSRLFVKNGKRTGIAALDSIVAVFSAAGYYQRSLQTKYSDFFLLVVALTLHGAVSAFTSTLEISDAPKLGRGMKVDDLKEIEIAVASRVRVRWEVVKEQLLALKSISRSVNELVANIFGFYLAEGILYYSVHFHQFFTEANPGWWEIWDIVYFFGMAVAILFLSADICLKMEDLKVWLSFKNNSDKIPFDELYLTMVDVETHTVSIRAGMFPITYSLLANVVGVIVTYFVICVQVA